jgi:energy-coupling factor transporter ATP-binding protein EcfA2
MLRYFRVENYKCLERVEFPLTPIHVLIGRNDSGKTSVLEAMLTYMTATSSYIAVGNALPAGWELKELVYHGAPKDSELSLSAVADASLARKEAISPPSAKPRGYGFSFKTPPLGQWSIAKQWIEEPTDEGGERAGESMPMPLRNTVVTEPALLKNDGKDFEAIEDQLELPRGMFGPAFLYRFDPKVLSLPAMPDVNRKFRMDTDGFGLSTVLDDIVGYDPELFLQLRRLFLDLFPMFKAVRVQTAAAYTRQYGAQGVHASIQAGQGKEIVFETKWGGTVHAREASEGALLFLAFLALVHLPAPHRPKLLLLEEPERGVYPKKLEELITALKSWVESSGENVPQIVMATHSPYLLSFFQPEEVTFLARAASGGVRARPLRDVPNIHERLSGGFYLGELWYNLSEEELFGDGNG